MDLQPLLVALMSENNDIRSQAEKSLNDEWLQNASDSLLLQLAAQTRVAESETVPPHLYINRVLTCQVRSFAVVLLRRVAFKTFKREDDSQTIWEGSADSTKQQVKAALLEGYEKEMVISVQHKICDTIADVARDDEENSRKKDLPI